MLLSSRDIKSAPIITRERECFSLPLIARVILTFQKRESAPHIPKKKECSSHPYFARVPLTSPESESSPHIPKKRECSLHPENARVLLIYLKSESAPRSPESECSSHPRKARVILASPHLPESGSAHGGPGPVFFKVVCSGVFFKGCYPGVPSRWPKASRKEAAIKEAAITIEGTVLTLST